jgi:hypothetical protein
MWPVSILFFARIQELKESKENIFKVEHDAKMQLLDTINGKSQERTDTESSGHLLRSQSLFHHGGVSGCAPEYMQDIVNSVE